MSRHHQANEADDEEAYLDLEDPDNKILEEGDDNEQADEDEGDDEDAAAQLKQQDQQQDEEQQQPTGPPPIDLNEVPDIEPERDDSVATFHATDNKPLHVVKMHPVDTTIAATGGEGDEVYIVKLPARNDTHTELFLLATLKGHTDTVTHLAFSPNGEMLATGSMDTTIRLWDCSTWTLLHTLTDLSGEIGFLLWHPSSLALVAGATDAQAALWNVKKGTLAVYFVGHRDAVTCGVWTPDNKKLVTGSADGSLSIFNPKTGEQEMCVAKDLSPDTAGITRLAFLTDDIVAAGCEDGTVHLVSIAKAKSVAHLEEIHEQSIESIAVSSDATRYATSSCDCKLVIWNAQNHTARLVLDVGESIIPATWVQNYIVAGCSDGAVRVWDGRSTSDEPVFAFMGHRRMVLDFAVDFSGQRFVTASDDGSLKLFALGGGGQ